MLLEPYVTYRGMNETQNNRRAGSSPRDTYKIGAAKTCISDPE